MPRARPPAAEQAAHPYPDGWLRSGSTGFSLAIKRSAIVCSEVRRRARIKYVYNILDLGYRADDIIWLVESGVLTLGYQSSSYFTDAARPGRADLPFLFSDRRRHERRWTGRSGTR